MIVLTCTAAAIFAALLLVDQRRFARQLRQHNEWLRNAINQSNQFYDEMKDHAYRLARIADQAHAWSRAHCDCDHRDHASTCAAGNEEGELRHLLHRSRAELFTQNRGGDR